MTKTFLPVLVAVAVSAFPATSSGNLSPGTPPDGWGGHDLQLARQYWGEEHSPLCATETIAIGGGGTEGAAGRATEPTQPGTDCVMYMVSGIGLVSTCQLTVHEYGHWLGLGHSPDPTSVMYPELSIENVPGVCWRLWVDAHPGSTFKDARRTYELRVFMSLGGI